MLYEGGVDWEGTLLMPTLPAGVHLDQATTGWILFNYLPTSLANQPADECGPDSSLPCPQSALDALGAVGFNPESYPLWAYHDAIYWGLTQKIYRLEFDPEYTNYTCTGVETQPCVIMLPADPSPPALVVPPTDPDALYNFAAREAGLTALATRIGASANTGDIKHPMITLQGDQDALLPIKTDADLYSQMVSLAGHDSAYRYYTVRGGNHVDGQFDDHNGVDNYGNTLLRPILPCARASLDAMSAWVEQSTAPPATHTIPRDPNASAAELANTCDISALQIQAPEGSPAMLLTTAFVAAAAIGAVGTRLRRRSRRS